jgi:exonuclease III
VPEPTKLYTWWSYRAHDWTVSDRGRRLDHIWNLRPIQQVNSFNVGSRQIPLQRSGFRSM